MKLRLKSKRIPKKAETRIKLRPKSKRKKKPKTKHKMKLRNKVKKIECQYCFHYFRSVFMPNKKLRECIETNRLITPESEQCDRYVPARYFYCDANKYFLTAKQCKYRKRIAKRKDNPCYRCRQFRMVRILILKSAEGVEEEE